MYYILCLHFNLIVCSLIGAAEQLNSLADWCENRFVSTQVVPDRPVTLDNARKNNHFKISINYFHDKETSSYVSLKTFFIFPLNSIKIGVVVVVYVY